MTNVSPHPKTVINQTEKVMTFTFEYSPVEDIRGGWLGGAARWKRSKKRFQSIEDAVRASGLWMQVCYDNDWPIAVRLVEMT